MGNAPIFTAVKTLARNPDRKTFVATLKDESDNEISVEMTRAAANMLVNLVLAAGPPDQSENPSLTPVLHSQGVGGGITEQGEPAISFAIAPTGNQLTILLPWSALPVVRQTVAQIEALGASRPPRTQ